MFDFENLEAFLQIAGRCWRIWKRRQDIAHSWVVVRLRGWALGQWRKFRELRPLDQKALGTFVVTNLFVGALWPGVSPDHVIPIPIDLLVGVSLVGWMAILTVLGYRVGGRIFRCSYRRLQGIL